METILNERAAQKYPGIEELVKKPEITLKPKVPQKIFSGEDPFRVCPIVGESGRTYPSEGAISSLVTEELDQGVKNGKFYISAIDACIRMGRSNEAYHVVARVSNAGVTSGEFYNAALNKFLQRKEETYAIGVLAAALNAGVEDENFYKTAIKFCKDYKKPRLLKDIIKYLNQTAEQKNKLEKQ